MLAACSGVVVAVKEDSQTGGADKKFPQCANYILIEHRDGAIARLCASFTAGRAIEGGASKSKREQGNIGNLGLRQRSDRSPVQVAEFLDVDRWETDGNELRQVHHWHPQQACYIEGVGGMNEQIARRVV